MATTETWVWVSPLDRRLGLLVTLTAGDRLLVTWVLCGRPVADASPGSGMVE